MYSYPIAKCRPEKVTYGNHSVLDEYEWMRNALDKDTIDFTDSQNNFTESYFGKYNDCFERYLKEQEEMAKNLMFRELVRTSGGITALGVYSDGITQTVSLSDEFEVKEVITDEFFAEDIHVYGILPNPINNNLCILLVLRDKAERMSGFVYDMVRKEVLTELEGSFSFGWSACGKYAFYCKAEHRQDGTIENTLRRYSIEEHKDEALYSHDGHAAYGMVYPMNDGGVVVNFAVDYHAGETVIYESQDNIWKIPFDGNAREYIGSYNNKDFFITDEDAPLGRIVCVEKGKEYDEKETYIEESKEKISQACVNQGKIICIYEQAGSQRISVFDEKRCRKDIKLPCEYGKVDMAAQEMSSEKPLFSYESFSCPPCVMELNLEEYSVNLLYSSQAPGENVVEELKYYTSRDGVRLAAYIVHSKDVVKNGNNKTLFYGYGGYNATNYVSAQACGMTISNWLEEGGIYVHCIIRGGGEFGEDWHRSGWKNNKINVFNDFCDIVEGVIQDGWTNPSKTAVCGLSNGGLLMTALITRRPDLFGCVIASVPHTDMLGFVYDDRGMMYITEYGDPREDDMFEYMKSYSPYHNIKENVKYPGIYVQAGAMDNNVPAYHAKKFAAKMQSLQGDRPVLLRVLPYGSHDRGTGKYFHRTIAEMRTFIEIELNLGEKEIG